MSIRSHQATRAASHRLAPDAVDALLADDSVDFTPTAPNGLNPPISAPEAPDRLLLRLQQQVAQLHNHQRRLGKLDAWSDPQGASRR